MAVEVGTVVPPAQISLGVEPSLRASLAQRAGDRVLVVDYFASRRCSVVVGDLTSRFEDAQPGLGYVELAGIQGVPVFVEARLVAVLSEGGGVLRLRGPSFARHVSVELDRPERWLDFLDAPGVLGGRHQAWRRPWRGPTHR
jgi:hypothetical protein